MVRAVLLLLPYLQETEFVVLTDHYVLKLIVNLAGATRKVVPWRFHLSQPDFEVVHLAWTIHQASDALSRHQTEKADDTLLDGDFPKMLITNNAEANAAYVCHCSPVKKGNLLSRHYRL